MPSGRELFIKVEKGDRVSQIQNQEVQGIAADNVTQWMRERIDELAAPLSFELIAGGHSNLTYLSLIHI